MKYCDMCGTSLKDEDDYCSECGAAQEANDSNSINLFNNDCSDLAESTIANIEKRVAKYYNDAYLSEGVTGKYVVLHHETTVSEDLCNVIVRYQDNKASDNGSAYTPVADVSVSMITGDCTIHSRPATKISKRTGAHLFICIIAVIMMLSFVCIPFICNDFWSFEDEQDRMQAVYFSDVIEDLSDDYSSDDDVPIHGIYYLGGMLCTLLILIGALGKNSGVCTFGSLVGIAICLYLFYQVHSGTTIWYVRGNNAHLTYGFYISCIGFVSILIASLYKEKG